jgi:NADPH:quinone reductase-like Zn-dependent oxidoreductase
MQAVVVRQFGDPKLLKVEEVPTPQPGDGKQVQPPIPPPGS